MYVNSSDVNIKSTVQSGSVFLFNEDSLGSDKNHYFIVLNHQPLSDELLLLVWARTLSEKVYIHIELSGLPYNTFVDITGKYNWSKKPTIIDCNKLIEKSIDILINKFEENKLTMIGQIDKNILVKLREGAINSPLVEGHIKKKLQVQ